MTLRRILSLMTGLSILMSGPLMQTASAQSSVTAVQSDRLIDRYRAYIGPADLVNSNGVRLTQPWQVIRQDRANFYQYKVRDRGDEPDTFFSDVKNRQALEAMLSNGHMTAEAANMIMRGDVWVDVAIYGRGDTGTWIDVKVSD